MFSGLEGEYYLWSNWGIRWFSVILRKSCFLLCPFSDRTEKHPQDPNGGCSVGLVLQNSPPLFFDSWHLPLFELAVARKPRFTVLACCAQPIPQGFPSEPRVRKKGLCEPPVNASLRGPVRQPFACWESLLPPLCPFRARQRSGALVKWNSSSVLPKTWQGSILKNTALSIIGIWLRASQS